MKVAVFPTTKSSYEVQYVFAVDNPENNVRRMRRKQGILFLVPANHPLAHQMGFLQLCQAAARRELLDISSPLNNTVASGEQK